MVAKLLHIIMNDGSRHFGELPRSISWYELRDHLRQLKGVVITQFLTDDVTEAWIDFSYRGHEFSVNDQLGAYWFFVSDPNCPDESLETILSHCHAVLR